MNKKRMADTIYFVPDHGVLQIGVAIWIKIVGPHETMLLACRHRKRTDPSHDITYGLSCLKFVYQTLMLGFKSTVPIDFRVIEAKYTVGFVNLNVCVMVAREHFEAKRTELILFAYLVCLVDHSANCLVLVHDDLGDEVFEREILFSEVEMRYDTLSSESDI